MWTLLLSLMEPWDLASISCGLFPPNPIVKEQAPEDGVKMARMIGSHGGLRQWYMALWISLYHIYINWCATRVLWSWKGNIFSDSDNLLHVFYSITYTESCGWWSRPPRHHNYNDHDDTVGHNEVVCFMQIHVSNQIYYGVSVIFYFHI